MAERTKDELLDHEYDGIREYDNPCPAWWHLIFIGSVVFSVFYFVFFHFGPNVGTNGWTVEESYDKAYVDDLQLQFAGEKLQADEATILRVMKGPDPEAEDARDLLAIGASVFKTNCKSCHAEDGKGDIGPNLTDDSYKNVKELVDIARVIENGAANGSMPDWKPPKLTLNQIVVVSAYVANMRGQNLEGRKAEGNVIPPWPEEAAEPSASEEGEGDETPTAEAASQENQEDDRPAPAED